MKNQEAIKFFEDMKECTYGKLEEVDRAIEALKKQVPKLPNFEGDGYDNEGNMIYDTWICPCCESRFEVEFEEYKHCPNCGQKIDWSE